MSGIIYIQFLAISLHRQPNQCFSRAAHQFLPLLRVHIRAFYSFQRKEIWFFSVFTVWSLVARSRKNEVVFFSLCGWESRTHIKMYPLSKVALCPFLFTHVNGDSMEPFVSKPHRLFQLCVELGFVCYCPLGAKKTPKMLSNTITNRMAWRRIQNLWAKAVFSLWPLDCSGLCFKRLHFYLKKETASVTTNLLIFKVSHTGFTSTWLQGGLHYNL